MSNWPMVRLGDVVSKTLSGEWGEDCSDTNGTKVLRTTNFTNDGVIDFSKIAYRYIDVEKIKAKKLLPGDIILEKSGGSDKQPVGRVVYFNEMTDNFLCNNFTQILRVDPSIIFSRYLFWGTFFLYKIGQTELLQNKTTGIRNLQVERYMDISIPLPPLDIQRHIAATLDAVTEIIKLRKSQLGELDLLVKSRFVEMFGEPTSNEKGWRVKLIKDFATVKIGPFGSLLHAEDYVENGIPLVNPSHIIDGEIVTDPKLTLTFEKFESMSAYALQVGDVVLGRRGEIGRCAVVDNGEYLCGTGSMFIRIERDYLPLMLQKIISSDAMRRVLENKAVGVTMMNLNAGMIANLEVIMPPIEIQTRYADFVRAADKSKFSIRQTIDETQTLRDSLMSEYFE